MNAAQGKSIYFLPEARNNIQSDAAKRYRVSLSSVKRWCRRYDGTWRALKERSHRPKGYPKQHTGLEEAGIQKPYRSPPIYSTEKSFAFLLVYLTGSGSDLTDGFATKTGLSQNANCKKIAPVKS